MITAKDLLDNHYNKYDKSQLKEHSSALYQKWFRQGNKKLYAINVYEYDFSGLPYHAKELDFSYAAEVRFYNKTCPSLGFDVSFHFEDKTYTVETMERFFENVYHKLECIPDPHND